MSTAEDQINQLQEEKRLKLIEKSKQMLDPRDPDIRRKIAEQVASLDPEDEEESMRWIEAVGCWNDEEWTWPDEAE